MTLRNERIWRIFVCCIQGIDFELTLTCMIGSSIQEGEDER